MSSIFKFKQFSIDQTNSPFKIGTDGVLAGALCPVNNQKTVLDIGTGTGLIALMLAQRSDAAVDAIEINEIALPIARENFENSPWKNRLTVYHCALQDFKPEKKYDLIVSNPPYFQNSLKSDSDSKNTARHTDTLPLDQLMKYATQLLSPAGKLCLIYPVKEGELLLNEAGLNNLNCSRIVNIRPRPEKKVKRLFIELQVKPSLRYNEELVIEENGRHQYSKKYKEITKEFYLNL
jgi:tRNA1Val (adenine37-N6)-methyltransferase